MAIFFRANAGTPLSTEAAQKLLLKVRWLVLLVVVVVLLVPLLLRNLPVLLFVRLRSSRCS